MKTNQEDVCGDVLFDIGKPATAVPPPELPPEPPKIVEPDRTTYMTFDPPLAGAIISPCEKYRYTLWRKFKNDGKKILFVLTNPSKADAFIDDPTVTRLISFGKREGASEICLVNPFAYRATDPKDLRKAAKAGVDIVGPENLERIFLALDQCDLCIVGWGTNGDFKDSGRNMMKFIEKNKPGRVPVRCLGVTKHGHPRHPLYVSGSAPLIPFMYDNQFLYDDDGVDF